MKITGIIAEYDPLHAGHIHHMRAAREQTNCDYLVCVMDGAFTQRGEPALFDKFARVRMALSAGADAVLELPQVYTVRPAQIFARGGIGILSAIGADCVCFGCETDDTGRVLETARTLMNEPPEVSAQVQYNLSLGMAYPRALGAALKNPYLEQPNFVLGVEYAKAVLESGARMELCAVRRTDDYHLGGASRVRSLLREGRRAEAEEGLPENIRTLYEAELSRESLAEYRNLDSLCLNTLRNADPALTYPDDAEGLLMRIIKLSRTAASTEELISMVKCKRYTRARITRLIANAVLDLPEAPDHVPYIRLLGARKTAAPLLKEMNLRSRGQLVSGASQLKNDPYFIAECRATDIRGLSTDDPACRRAGREFTQKFISV